MEEALGHSTQVLHSVSYKAAEQLAHCLLCCVDVHMHALCALWMHIQHAHSAYAGRQCVHGRHRQAAMRMQPQQAAAHARPQAAATRALMPRCCCTGSHARPASMCGARAPPLPTLSLTALPSSQSRAGASAYVDPQPSGPSAPGLAAARLPRNPSELACESAKLELAPSSSTPSMMSPRAVAPASGAVAHAWTVCAQPRQRLVPVLKAGLIG